MPVVQQQNSSFASRLGGRVAQANVEHKDKPVDTGNRRLPAGIRSGVAKLSAMYTKQQTEENGLTPKGETFFRASAIALLPKEHNGEKVEGLVTQVMIPLCDIPAKGQRKAKTFSEQWYEFQNLFKLLGIAPPNETLQTDPTGQRTEAYYFAAMQALTDPKRPQGPVYITFSTRGWTPPPTPLKPKPDPMVFEEWHGLATPEQIANVNGQYTPAAGFQDNTAAPTVPTFNEFDPPPTTTTQESAPVNDQQDPADVVAALVETAMNDPEGATEEGAAAAAQLEEMAWAAGWSKEHTKTAADWAAVGDMILNPPSSGTEATPPTGNGQATLGSKQLVVGVGSKWKFCKRTKEGAKLKNNKGEEFPPQEVEVVTVDNENKTCTLKTAKDGKDVIDIRSKKPVVVKWEWLE